MRVAIFFPVLLSFAIACAGQHRGEPVRSLIVVFDGLRPDYITRELMPSLHAFRQEGCYGAAHHSVFPTVTRVNASSYATGSYPVAHGILGNSVFFPALKSTQVHSTGDASVLQSLSRATQDSLLTAKSLGEVLDDAGEVFRVFSSGSSGQAFLQNHKVGSGAVIHPELILPETIRKDVIGKVGTPPAAATPNTAQHEWATNALLALGVSVGGPAISAIWFSDPDGAAHEDGMGAPRMRESLKAVDRQFGRIIKALRERGLIHRFNIVVTTDHGFVTHIGGQSLSDFLVQQGLKRSIDSDDVLLAGNAIFVKDQDSLHIKNIVDALQGEEWVGAIFTAASVNDSLKGRVDGTLSFQTIHWNHPSRQADILVDYAWDNRENPFGYSGASFARGVAGHGGSSPYEIRIPLIVSGPAFKRRSESGLPTSNVDIVPTLLHLHGIARPSGMQGRVLFELLAGVNVTPPEIVTYVVETSVAHPWGTYHLALQRSAVGGHQYVDFTRTERIYHSPGK